MKQIKKELDRQRRSSLHCAVKLNKLHKMQGRVVHLILYVWCDIMGRCVREGVRPTPTCGDWGERGRGACPLVPFVCNCTNGDGGMGHAASPYITSRAGLGWATLIYFYIYGLSRLWVGCECGLLGLFFFLLSLSFLACIA